MEDLFRQYWWLIFPVFGLVMSFWGMLSHERRSNSLMDLIKSYVDQGKDPPADLLRMASEGHSAHTRDTYGSSGRSVWTPFVFAALAAGFGVGAYLTRGEDESVFFLMVAVVTGILALGAVLNLLIGRKP